MRFIFALVLLASCTEQPAPQAELAGEPSLAEMTYICTPDGREVLRVKSGGAVDNLLTGERCNYAAWRADVDANGPVHSRRRMRYADWRRTS